MPYGYRYIAGSLLAAFYTLSGKRRSPLDLSWKLTQSYSLHIKDAKIKEDHGTFKIFS